MKVMGCIMPSVFSFLSLPFFYSFFASFALFTVWFFFLIFVLLMFFFWGGHPTYLSPIPVPDPCRWESDIMHCEVSIESKKQWQIYTLSACYHFGGLHVHHRHFDKLDLESSFRCENFFGSLIKTNRIYLGSVSPLRWRWHPQIGPPPKRKYNKQRRRTRGRNVTVNV